MRVKEKCFTIRSQGINHIGRCVIHEHCGFNLHVFHFIGKTPHRVEEHLRSLIRTWGRTEQDIHYLDTCGPEPRIQQLGGATLSGDQFYNQLGLSDPFAGLEEIRRQQQQVDQDFLTAIGDMAQQGTVKGIYNQLYQLYCYQADNISRIATPIAWQLQATGFHTKSPSQPPEASLYALYRSLRELMDREMADAPANLQLHWDAVACH